MRDRSPDHRTLEAESWSGGILSVHRRQNSFRPSYHLVQGACSPVAALGSTVDRLVGCTAKQYQAHCTCILQPSALCIDDQLHVTSSRPEPLQKTRLQSEASTCKKPSQCKQVEMLWQMPCRRLAAGVLVPPYMLNLLDRPTSQANIPKPISETACQWSD